MALVSPQNPEPTMITRSPMAPEFVASGATLISGLVGEFSAILVKGQSADIVEWLRNLIREDEYGHQNRGCGHEPVIHRRQVGIFIDLNQTANSKLAWFPSILLQPKQEALELIVT